MVWAREQTDQVCISFLRSRIVISLLFLIEFQIIPGIIEIVIIQNIFASQSLNKLTTYKSSTCSMIL